MRHGEVDNPGVVAGQVSDARTSDLWNVRWQLNGALSERHTVELGGEVHTGDADYSYQNHQQLTPDIARLYGKALSSSLDTVLSPYRRDQALYFADRVRIGARLSSEWGARVQHTAGLGLTAAGCGTRAS